MKFPDDMKMDINDLINRCIRDEKRIAKSKFQLKKVYEEEKRRIKAKRVVNALTTSDNTQLNSLESRSIANESYYDLISKRINTSLKLTRLLYVKEINQYPQAEINLFQEAFDWFEEMYSEHKQAILEFHSLLDTISSSEKR